MSVWILTDGVEELTKQEILMLKLERRQSNYEIYKNKNHYRLYKNEELKLISLDFEWLRSYILKESNDE